MGWMEERMTSPIGIPKNKPSREDGFTLIELVLVVVILMVVVGISTPLFRNTYRELPLRESAHNISRLMAYARERSVAEGKKHRIQFDTVNRSYRLTAVEGGDEGQISKRLQERMGKKFF